jgi:hypothetical protein
MVGDVVYMEKKLGASSFRPSSIAQHSYQFFEFLRLFLSPFLSFFLSPFLRFFFAQNAV